MHVAVGHAEDAERPVPRRSGAVQPAGQVAVLALQRRQHGGPVGAVAGAVGEQAEVGHAVLDQLQPGIAAAEQHDLDMPAQRRLLRGRRRRWSLKPTSASGSVRRLPRQAAQIVLAGRQQQRRAPAASRHRCAPRPARRRAPARRGAASAPSHAARRSSASSNARRDRPAAANGSRASATRPRCTRRIAAIGEAPTRPGRRRARQFGQRLAADELAADLVRGRRSRSSS